MAERPHRGLHRLAVVTAGATLVLLFIGGLVTTTGSGLAVPDWPLSFGQVFPPMVGGVLFEHGHRLAATLVGALTLVLTAWITLRETRPAVRLLGMLSLFAVILQGVLGGVTVLYRLPIGVSVTHACLAQIFFCLTVTLAVVTGDRWQRPQPTVRPSGGLASLAAATTALLFAQLVLGALMRHMKAGLAIPDFPLAFGQLLPPLVTPYITIHFAHRVGAVVVLFAVAALAIRVRGEDPTVRRPAFLAAALVAVQIALGASIIWSQRAVVPTTTHVVVGASLLASCLVATLRAFRLLPRPTPATAALGIGQGALA